MEIIIHGDKIRITKAMNEYINEKLGKLDKYLENSETVRANVVVKVKNNQQTVEVLLFLLTLLFKSNGNKKKSKSSA